MPMCLRGRCQREGVFPKTSLQLLFSLLCFLAAQASSTSGSVTMDWTGVAARDGVNCPALERTGTRPGGDNDRGHRGYLPSSFCKGNAVADARNPAAYSGRRKCRFRGKSRGSAVPVRRFIEGMRGGAAAGPDPYKARMQVMITRNMRKVLVEELGYLSDEVDDMDPQIAAVVIEKSLPRPRAGMPIVWRRTIRRQGSASTNPLAAIARAVRRVAGVTVDGVAFVAAFPFRMLRACVGKTRTAAVAVVLVLAAVPVILASSQNTNSEGRFWGSSAVGGLAKTLGGSFGALWAIEDGGDDGVRSPGTPIAPTAPRKSRRFERRTSKAGTTAKNASTVKRRGKRKGKASANPSGSASFGRRRDAPTTDDVITTDGVFTDAKPDGVGGGGRGTRWDEEEEDLDEEGEETVHPGKGERVGSGAEEGVLFEDLTSTPLATGTVEVLEEIGEGELNGGKGTRWGRRSLSEHIPSEEELEAWEARSEPSDSWLDRGINKIAESFFGGGKGGGD